MIERAKVNGRAYITIDEDSRAVRLFERVWTVKPTHTCWFFWGYVFMPAVVLLMVVSWPFRKAAVLLLDAFFDWKDAREERKEEDEDIDVLVAKLTKPPSRRGRFLRWVSDAFGGFWFRFGRLVRGAVMGVGVLGALALAAWLIVIVLSDPLHALAVVGVLVGCFVVALIVIALIVAYAERTSDRPGLDQRLLRYGRMVHDNTCAEIVFTPQEGPER